MKNVRSMFASSLLTCALALLAFASPAPAQTHALAKVAKVAVAPVAHPKLFTKATLGSIMFVAENGVDVVHAGFHVANVGLTAASAGGKIPVLDEVALVASDGDKYSGKLDTWMERQEDYHFGSHN